LCRLEAREISRIEIDARTGTTGTSLVRELAAHKGLSFGELVKWIAEDASIDR
jgi:D-alanine-D-alanine ligase